MDGRMLQAFGHLIRRDFEARADQVWTLAARGSHSFWKGAGQVVVRLLDPNPVNLASPSMSRNRDEFVHVNQKESEKQRDKLLLALLKTPPQPRPKRVRANAKLVGAKSASAEKPAPTA
jgi:hypothetical protein